MLLPIIKVARSGNWDKEFAPHDAGCYPCLNGQAYEKESDAQMPVEECGNILIMTAVLCNTLGNNDFARGKRGFVEKNGRNISLKTVMTPATNYALMILQGSGRITVI